MWCAHVQRCHAGLFLLLQLPVVPNSKVGIYFGDSLLAITVTLHHGRHWCECCIICVYPTGTVHTDRVSCVQLRIYEYGITTVATHSTYGTVVIEL